uniref:Uncharacterized protein n=1 Tax=Ananas comosus var. bracteatus TaxID=296719 RepID=A0A6V7Q5S1_ANACO|nr:unnamed protein product [Ananas comosus var. bracteatus]
MARPLPLQLDPSTPFTTTTTTTTTTAYLLLAVIVAAIAAVIISLCTTHKHSKMSAKQQPNKKNNIILPTSSSPQGDVDSRRSLLASLSNVGSKAAVITKLISWKSDDCEGGGEVAEEQVVAEESDEEAALWRKSIIRGGRCRPLDFSGQILYDINGNQLRPPQGGGGTGKV